MWPFSRKKTKIDKDNPAQRDIVLSDGLLSTTGVNSISFKNAYNKIEVVRRGTDLIVDCCAPIRVDVGSKLEDKKFQGVIRPKKVDTLLNFMPNPYIPRNEFMRHVFADLILEGNAFLYFDGAHLHNLPAINVKVVSSSKTFVEKYVYLDNKEFSPFEIIHIKENSSQSIFRGESRLDAAQDSINLLLSMYNYQKNYFDNDALVGLVMYVKETLTDRIRERKLQEWMQFYNPKSGGRRPMIVDGERKIENLSRNTFSELDFENSIARREEKVLKALGVPPVLIDSGNNANITPNLKLFYLTTIIPLYSKYVSALEFYFGYDLKINAQEIEALRPELRDLGDYLTSITNAGIITRNEARADIRKPAMSDDPIADTLIVPANIAGSAVNPGVGGKPPTNNNN